MRRAPPPAPHISRQHAKLEPAYVQSFESARVHRRRLQASAFPRHPRRGAADRILRGPRGELHGRRRTAARAARRVARTLCVRYAPESFSEHLAWSSHDDVYLNDLLPLPYTQQTLRQVAEHIDEVQTALGRQMLLENPSTY